MLVVVRCFRDRPITGLWK